MNDMANKYGKGFEREEFDDVIVYDMTNKCYTIEQDLKEKNLIMLL